MELCTNISLRLQQRQQELSSLISQEMGSPITFATMVQTALPIMDFGSMAHLVEHIPWEQQIGNSLIVREPVGVVGGDHAVELPAAPDRGQGRAALAAGLHGGGQAERGRAAERLRPGGGL